ncbi:MAG: SPOR domain-containing protein [Terriglobia bacterium]
MSDDARPGLSAIQLALVFLTGVAVCAVFFALGFAVARNQQAPTVSAESNTEQVPPPAPAPTPVNNAAGRTASQNTSPAPATAEGGIVLRTVPSPSAGLSASPAAPSPAPPARVREAPPKSESKRLPAAAISSPAPSAASQLALAPDSVAAPPGAAPATGGRIVVQVSAVRVQQDAEALVNLLKSRGYPAFLVTPEAAGAGDKLFRVQVGPYKSDPEAAGVRNKLVADGFKPFVRH